MVQQQKLKKLYMEIEKEIKQKKFQNEFVKAEINILFTAGWISNQSNKFFRDFGISMQQYNVLRILRGQYPNAVMLSQITERMIDKMSNATRLVEKLRLKMLVTRELNADNRRQVDIVITEDGLRLLIEIDKEIEKATIKRIHLDENEAKLLNSLLDKLRG